MGRARRPRDRPWQRRRLGDADERDRLEAGARRPCERAGEGRVWGADVAPVEGGSELTEVFGRADDELEGVEW